MWPGAEGKGEQVLEDTGEVGGGEATRGLCPEGWGALVAF